MDALAGLSFNPVSDFEALTEYQFMVNALWAGTIVAVLAGAAGWLLVLRRQAFAGHTLSVLAFPGAAAAALAGLPLAVGYFGACAVGAMGLAAVSRGRGAGGGAGGATESAAIGTLQALALGLGFLFVNLYDGQLANLESLLFGTFLGITSGQVQTLLWVAVATLLALAAIGRPLLFASLDAEVARAAGVPTRLLGTAFLLLLGLAVAATAQITGALLVFALLVTPAATAQLLTARPGLGLALSVLLALLVSWVGLAIAYFSPHPVGFWVTTLAFGLYVLARIGVELGRRRAARASGETAAAGAGAI